MFVTVKPYVPVTFEKSAAPPLSSKFAVNSAPKRPKNEFKGTVTGWVKGKLALLEVACVPAPGPVKAPDPPESVTAISSCKLAP